MDTSVVMIFRSQHFWACFCAWLVAQFTKMLVGFLRTRRLDFSYLVSTGGMPSAHSAAACTETFRPGKSFSMRWR